MKHFRKMTLVATAMALVVLTETAPSSVLTFSNCERSLMVHKPGRLEVTHIAGTTNGTVFSEEAEWTTGSPFLVPSANQ